MRKAWKHSTRQATVRKVSLDAGEWTSDERHRDAD